MVNMPLPFNLAFAIRGLGIQRPLGYSSLHRLEGWDLPLDFVYDYDGDLTLFLPDNGDRPTCRTSCS